MANQPECSRLPGIRSLARKRHPTWFRFGRGVPDTQNGAERRLGGFQKGLEWTALMWQISSYFFSLTAEKFWVKCNKRKEVALSVEKKEGGHP